MLPCAVLLIWQGEAPPRAHLYIEEWVRQDTTWVLRLSQIPNAEGQIGDDIQGPAWVKARWRWDVWRVFQWAGATTVPPAPQTLYGPFSAPIQVREIPEASPGRIEPPQRIRIP